MKWVENGESTATFLCSKEKTNIFLIGDSIRKGYCATVKEQLAGVAETFYVTDNCRSSQYIIFNLKKWAGLFDDPSLVNVVCFNCGHWDTAHWSGHEFPLTGEGEYEKNLQIIVDLLKKFFPNAKPVFLTTSPINPKGFTGNNPRDNVTIDAYNARAKEVMARNGICVYDLNAHMRDWGSEYYADYCHLTAEGFAMLGRYVAEKLKEQL
ncbi:MAG: SGNH/GDSL hydrolase family protein [Clostridia bacterium]|nr:SGNH/GDSL hydrolase family protein [Clostridia bacterium]